MDLSILSVMKELTRPADSLPAKTSKTSERNEDMNINTNFIINELHDGFRGSSSSKMQNLLEEFTKLYTDKLQRVEDLALEDEKEYLLRKVGVLEAWVEDLGEQNTALVSTVEDLEREASQRVQLLQEKLDKMASVTRNSCVSLRDQQLEVNAIMNQKVLNAENESLMLRETIHSLEKCNSHLLEENGSLHSDLESFIEEVSRNSRRSFKDGKYDMCRFKGHSEDGGCSYPGDHSENGFTPARLSTSEENSTLEITRGQLVIQSELIRLRTINERNSRDIIQKDREISHLRAQLTDLEEKLGKTQMQLEEAKDALDHLRDAGLLKHLENSSLSDFNPNLHSPSGHLKNSWKDSQTSSTEVEGASKIDIEARLSNNIDILASRLNDLEEECEEMRDQYTCLKATHDLCEPTINRLKEQLNSSRMSMDELRSVLTSEVAERHDVVLSMRQQLEEMRCQNHETNLQLQMKCDVIRELRKHQRDDLHEDTTQTKNEVTTVNYSESETNLGSSSKEEIEMNDSSTNTDRAASQNYSNAFQAIHLSKLENEIAEKNILIRELQNHLTSSRQEVNLKDETIVKIEGKLDSTRRNYDEREDRLYYLKGQLTFLQLEVSRLHGQSHQLKNQLGSKSLLVRKLEDENTSLSSQLNDRSSLIEANDKRLLQMESQVDHLRQEIGEQKLTIVTLQDALVATKQTCDKLRNQMENDDADKEPLKGLLEKTADDLQEALNDIRLKEDQLHEEHVGLDQLSDALAFERQRNFMLREKIRTMQGSIVDKKSQNKENSTDQKNVQNVSNSFLMVDKQDVEVANSVTQTADFELHEKLGFGKGETEFLLFELKSLRNELERLQDKSYNETSTQIKDNTQDKTCSLKVELLERILKTSFENECLCHQIRNKKCSSHSPDEDFCFCQRINGYMHTLMKELQRKIQVLIMKRIIENDPYDGHAKKCCRSKQPQVKYSHHLEEEELATLKAPLVEISKNEDEACFYEGGPTINSRKDEFPIDEEVTDTFKARNEVPLLSQKIRDMQKDILESRKHQDRAETSTRAILRRLRQLLDDPSCHSSSSQKSCRNPSELMMLKQQLLEAKKALEEEKRLRLLLSNDAQTVIRTVGEWLQKQKEANSLLASKFHQQNRHFISCSTQKRRQVESGFNMDDLENLIPPHVGEHDASSLLDNDSGICDNGYLQPTKRYETHQSMSTGGGRDSSYPSHSDQLDLEEINSMYSAGSSSTSTRYIRKHECLPKANSVANNPQHEKETIGDRHIVGEMPKNPKHSHQDGFKDGQPADSFEKLILDLERASGFLHCN